MPAKPKTSIFKKSIALATLWIFLFSNVSFALRPVAMRDRPEWKKVITEHGYEIIVLTNEDGNSIEVIPGMSATIRSMKVGGKEILYYPKDVITAAGGIPGPFFFFANRIEGGKFEWEGKQYDITPFFGQGVRSHEGNALHGILDQAAWEVESSGPIMDTQTGRRGVYITLTYDAGKNTTFKGIFGSEVSAKLRVTYKFIGDDLTIETNFTNDGKKAFPFSTAEHPWFYRDGENVTFSSSDTEHWVAPNRIPQGLEPVAGKHDFTTPKKLGEPYDDAYRGAQPDANGYASATLVRQDGTSITLMRELAKYPHGILWAPTHIPNMSIEAQSSATNAVNMRDNEKATFKALVPGEEWHGTVIIKIGRTQPAAAGTAPSRAEVVAARIAALGPASLEDLRRNETDTPANVVYVGIMCVDLIHRATGIIPGMENSPLTLAGNIDGSIDPDGSKESAYVADLPQSARTAATDLSTAISGGPATSSARVFKQLAGKGANASLITSVGQNGAELVRTHEAIGVDMINTNVSATRSTAKTLVFELGGGERRFLHSVGASAELTINMLKPGYFKGKKVVEFGGIELSGLMPDLDKALAMAKQQGCITVLDTVVDVPHQWRDFSKRYGRNYLKAILGLIDVFTPSIGEAVQIYADYVHPDDTKAADALKKKIEEGKDKTPAQITAFFVEQGAKAVFLKNGKDGVYACIAPGSIFNEITEPTAFHIPILRGFEEVSNTGTGDAFSGAMVYAAAKGWPARKAAMLADVVGGMCVEHKGGTIEDESLVDALYHMERLEAQMAHDAAAAATPRTFYDLTPGNPDEPFWHLVQRATSRIEKESDKKTVRSLLAAAAMDLRNVTLDRNLIEEISPIRKKDGNTIGDDVAVQLIRDARLIGQQASTTHVPDSIFWQFAENYLAVSGDEMRRMVDDIHAEMDRGLGDEEPSSLAMIPTYVGPPQGNEEGTFLALDVGGTNVRWLKVDIEPGQPVKVVSDGGKKMPSDVIQGGTADAFFGFITDRGREFLQTQSLSTDQVIPAGFTWSYPVIMNSVNTGTHLQWAKEIDVSGVVGENPTALLSKKLKDAGISNVEIAALCNDTVGTFMARAITDRSCIIGIILGTGSNACYPERMKRIKKWRGDRAPSFSTLGGFMLINMEWGNLGGRKKLRDAPVDEQEKIVSMDSFDMQLDIASGNPGDHPFEKQISGLYLGESVRLRCAEAIRRGLLFSGAHCAAFAVKNGFGSENLDPIIKDNTRHLARINSLLRRLGITNSTFEDRQHLQRLCLAVVKRAARRSAAATVAVATRVDPELKEKHTAAIDGSVYQNIHSFRVEMNAAYRELLGSEKATNLNSVLTKDGSGIGAGVTAAVVSAEYFRDGTQVNRREWRLFHDTAGSVVMQNIATPTLVARQIYNGLWEKETIPQDWAGHLIAVAGLGPLADQLHAEPLDSI